MADSKRDTDLYGSDPKGAENKVEIPIGVKPTLDVHGEKDSRAESEGNHGKS